MRHRRLFRVPVDELLVMCDYIEERGFLARPIGKPICYLFGSIDQIQALRKRLPSRQVRIPIYSHRGYAYSGDEKTAFNREDIKALLKVLGCVPVSHHYRTIYKATYL